MKGKTFSGGTHAPLITEGRSASRRAGDAQRSPPRSHWRRPLSPRCGGGSGKPTLTWYINPDPTRRPASRAPSARPASPSGAAPTQYTIKTQQLPQRRHRAADPAGPPAGGQGLGIDLMSLDPVFTAEFAEAGFLAPIPHDLATRACSSDTLDGRRSTAPPGTASWSRRPAVGQHPGAVVPQVVRAEGRPGHDQAGDLGPDHQGRRRQRRHGRRPGQQVRGLRRVDQRPGRGRRRRHRRATPRRARTPRSTSAPRPGREAAT